MPKNSRAKGKTGELEAAKLLRDFGFEARRGQQFSGGPESGDLKHSVPNVHFEVKRTEKLRLYDAIEQAKTDAPKGHDPVVLHRMNQKEWVIIMPAENFLKIMKEFEV